MSNKIRKLSIGAEVKQRFHYVVDDIKAVYTAIINGKVGNYNLSEIVEAENHYHLYLKSGDEIHFWKKEPKNQFTAIEYFID